MHYIPISEARAARSNATGPIPDEVEDTSGVPISTDLLQAQTAHHYAEAHESILSRLNEDSDMNPTRRGVLKSALEVVSQMSSLSSGFAIDSEMPTDATFANTNPKMRPFGRNYCISYHQVKSS